MPDELVEIARFYEAPQAHSARIVLEEAGIECFVPDIGMNVWPDGVGGGVPLLVAAADVEQAVALLRDTPAADDLEIAAEDDGEPQSET